MGVAILKKTDFSAFRDVTGDNEGYRKGKKADKTRGWRWSLTPRLTMREKIITCLIVTKMLQNISYHCFRVK